MRWLSVVLVASTVVAGCGNKKAPAAAAQAAAEAVADATPPPPPPEPVVEEPVEPEPPANNADFQAALTMASGTVVSGHVVRVERGYDRYAEDGWTDDESKLVLSLESDSDMLDASWDDIKSVRLQFKGRNDIDCVYESAFTPWMYMCTMPTISTATATDGKSWKVSSRHKWRFTFDDGSAQEFYVYKVPVREQDSATAGLDTVENYDLYGRLQAELMNTIKGETVTQIKITK